MSCSMTIQTNQYFYVHVYLHLEFDYYIENFSNMLLMIYFIQSCEKKTYRDNSETKLYLSVSELSDDHPIGLFSKL